MERRRIEEEKKKEGGEGMKEGGRVVRRKGCRNIAFSYSFLYFQLLPQIIIMKITVSPKHHKVSQSHYYMSVFPFIVHTIYRNFKKWVLFLNKFFFQMNKMRPTKLKSHAPGH